MICDIALSLIVTGFDNLNFKTLDIDEQIIIELYFVP